MTLVISSTVWSGGTPIAASVLATRSVAATLCDGPLATANAVTLRPQPPQSSRHAIGWHALGATFDRLLNQRIDGEAARRGRGGELTDERGHVRRNAPRQASSDVLSTDSCATNRQQQGDAESLHNESTLLRRPNPSSTAGAAGSAIQRAPSRTNAYWCCPAGNVSVAAQTPGASVRTRGVAAASH